MLNVEALDAIHESTSSRGMRSSARAWSTRTSRRAAASAGLFYGPDPASWETCTIGGNVATNAGGLCCVKYGVTSDWVQALQVVLPGGEVIRTGHRTAKGVAGYDLTGLFVGSEGTLGVVTEAVVRLEPAPDPALTALAVFDSLDAAVAGIVALRRDRHRPCLLEIIDRTSVRAIQAFGDFGFPDDCAAVLLVQSDRPGHVADDVRGMPPCWSPRAPPTSRSPTTRRSRRRCSRAPRHEHRVRGHGRAPRRGHVRADRPARRVRPRHRGHRGAPVGAHPGERPRGDGNLHPSIATPTTTPTAWPGRGRPSTTSSGSGSRSTAPSPASTASARSRCRGSASSSGTRSSTGSAASRPSSTRPGS